MFDDVLAIAKFDNLWLGKELLYHGSTDKIMWNNRAPNVGIADHALSCSHFLRFCASTAWPPREFPALCFRSWWPCMFSGNELNFVSFVLKNKQTRKY